MKNENKSQRFFILILIIECILIVFALIMQKFGKISSVSFSDIFSNVTLIIVGAFIVTLIVILICIKFIKDAESIGTKGNSNTTRLSQTYLEDILEQRKSKKEILGDLSNSGYSKKEISQFIKKWERREEKHK
jgi:competence protein ComGC